MEFEAFIEKGCLELEVLDFRSHGWMLTNFLRRDVFLNFQTLMYTNSGTASFGIILHLFRHEFSILGSMYLLLGLWGREEISPFAPLDPPLSETLSENMYMFV